VSQHDKAEVTVVSEKGQVVIPLAVRRKLGIEAKTKLLVYGYQDAVILKKLTIPDVTKELEAIYRRVDQQIARHGELSSEEISKVVQGARLKKRLAAKGAR
jgi:AbrB family looped-hinge helix DNA binding protein